MNFRNITCIGIFLCVLPFTACSSTTRQVEEPVPDSNVKSPPSEGVRIDPGNPERVRPTHPRDKYPRD